jgi:hypothetical protein
MAVLGAQAAEIDDDTGLVVESGVELVKMHCTVCHSARLITQNRANRDGWLAMIRWMQEKHGLWPLGENEMVILDYLEENYSPSFVGSRPPRAPHLMPGV